MSIVEIQHRLVREIQLVVKLEAQDGEGEEDGTWSSLGE